MGVTIRNWSHEPGQYLVGDQYSATGIYWACFSNLLQPQDAGTSPMPGFLRKSYELTSTLLLPFSRRLIEHRDYIFKQHLETPLTF